MRRSGRKLTTAWRWTGRRQRTTAGGHRVGDFAILTGMESQSKASVSATYGKLKNLPPTGDLTRITLAVLSIGVLIAGSLWVLQPFLGAATWATMVVVATWPIMLAVEKRLGGRRWLAVTIMTLAMLLVL